MWVYIFVCVCMCMYVRIYMFIGGSLHILSHLQIKGDNGKEFKMKNIKTTDKCFASSSFLQFPNWIAANCIFVPIQTHLASACNSLVAPSCIVSVTYNLLRVFYSA